MQVVSYTVSCYPPQPPHACATSGISWPRRSKVLCRVLEHSYLAVRRSQLLTLMPYAVIEGMHGRPSLGAGVPERVAGLGGWWSTWSWSYSLLFCAMLITLIQVAWQVLWYALGGVVYHCSTSLGAQRSWSGLVPQWSENRCSFRI